MTTPLYTRAFLAACIVHLVGALSQAMWFLLPLYVKALSFIAGPAAGPIDPDYDYTTFNEVVASAADAYAQAGVKDPRQELAMAEVHDCFTPTELVLMEDLGFAARGTAWKEVLAGTFDLDAARFGACGRQDFQARSCLRFVREIDLPHG